MIDPKLTDPPTETVTVDDETLAAINRGIEDTKHGRTVSLDEAHKMIPHWLSKFASRPKR